MFHLIYSNSYEILSAELIAAVSTQTAGSAEAIFSPVKIITPTSAIRENLRRQFCDSTPHGICAGMEFISMQKWMSQFMRNRFTGEDSYAELNWLIYHYICHHTQGALAQYAQSSPEVRYELACRISDVVNKYVNYRFDWAQLWCDTAMKPDGYLGREGEYLNQCNEHLDWQKELFHFICTQKGSDAAEHFSDMIRYVETQFRKLGVAVASPVSEKRAPIHIFLNTLLAPLSLPILALESIRTEIFVYLMMPCSQYWMDTEAPVGLDDDRNGWLRRNGASTRALVKRFWTFVPESGKVDGSQVNLIEARMPEVKGKTRQIKPVTVFNPSDLTQTELNPLFAEREESYFVNPLPERPENGTLLKKIAHSVLMDSKPIALEDFDPATDQSVRILKAPGLVRQIEAVADWIQTLVANKDKELMCSDILVVTPDINSAAPLIEGVMKSLDVKIAYNIVGRNLLADESTAQTILCAQKLLFGRMQADRFFAVLESPLFIAANHTSATDVAIMRRWLLMAGFRYGINEQHLSFVAKDEDCDGTLERALERLLFGSLVETNESVAFGDTFTFSGTENGGFESVHEKPEVLKLLARVYRVLASFSSEMLAEGDHNWSEFSDRFIEAFFPACRDRNVFSDEIALYTRLTQHVKEKLENAGCKMQKGSNNLTEVQFPLFVSALEHEFTSRVSQHKKEGAVTFSDMHEMRFLPFKAIAIIGLDNASAFPGVIHAEEFDLMETLRMKHHLGRIGDRDSRADNRNVFMDLVLAARQYLLITYDAGEDPRAKDCKRPSVVLEDFLQWLRQCGLQTEKITACEPLSRYSSAAFAKDDKRFFITQDLASHRAFSCITNYVKNEPPFVTNQALSVKQMKEELHLSESVLQLHKLVDVLLNPDKYLMRELGFIYEFIDDDSEKSQGVRMSQNALFKAQLQRETVENLRNGGEGPICRLYDPRLGDVSLRENTLSDFVPQIKKELSCHEFLTRGAKARGESARSEWIEWGNRKIESVLPEMTIWTMPDGTERTVDITASNADIRRLIMRALTFAMTGKAIEVWKTKADLLGEEHNPEYVQKKDSRGRKKAIKEPGERIWPADIDCARMVLGGLVDFYDAVRETFNIAPGPDEMCPLWHGLQEERESRKELMKDIQENFKDAFMKVKPKTRLDKAQKFREGIDALLAKRGEQ